MPFSSLLPLANIILKILTGASWNFKMAPNLAKKSHPRVYCIIIKKECFKNWLSNWQIMGFIKTSLRFSFNPHNANWLRGEKSSVRTQSTWPLTWHSKAYPGFLGRDWDPGVGWGQSLPQAPLVLKCCHNLGRFREWRQSTFQCQGSGFVPLHKGDGPGGGLVQSLVHCSGHLHLEHVQYFSPWCFVASLVTLRWLYIARGTANS